MNNIGCLENIKLMANDGTGNIYHGTCVFKQKNIVATLEWAVEHHYSGIKSDDLPLYDFELISMHVLPESITVDGYNISSNKKIEYAQKLLFDFFSMPKSNSEHVLKQYIIRTIENVRSTLRKGRNLPKASSINAKGVVHA